MRRLSGLLLAGAIMLLPAFSQGHSTMHAQAAQALTFDGDTAILTVAIKPDKTAAFEEIMTKVRDALLKSEKPERKQQAAGWKVVKSPTPMKDGNVIYMHVISPVVKGATAMKDGNIIYMHVLSPVVKGADYTILALLYEANPDPAQQRALFEQYRDAFAANLGGGAFTTVVDLSKP